MNEGTPSRTALGVALRRAAHQILDRPPIFLDPLATRIAGEKLRNQAEQHDAARGLRAFVAARSRYAEDELAHSVSLGIRQYVVLGAGLDTFAYRNPFAPSLQVFEVDHPDTQLWKKERLHSAAIDIPASVTFVPVNFETQSLRAELHAAPHFDPFQPAFFSMLGVVPYLSRDALLTTSASSPPCHPPAPSCSTTLFRHQRSICLIACVFSFWPREWPGLANPSAFSSSRKH
jgi:methyltransferase (TIGR00027 family)